jgi:hypothetical protein
MKLHAIIRALALASTSIVLVACEGAGSSNPVAGTGGVLGGGGKGGGGSNGVGGSTVGAGGSSAGAGGIGAGAGAGGAGAAGRGAGGTGAGTGGGMGTAGMAGGGAAGAPGASTEDDGADCMVAALPDSAALPAIAKLPDPFTKLDGTRMTTKAEWRCRREELRKQAEKYAYGIKPAKPTVTGTVSSTSITVTVGDQGKTSTFTSPVILPGTGTGPYPAIVVLGGATFGAPLDNTVVKGEGIAIINYDPYAVGAENTGRANKQGAFYTIYGSNSTTGLLVAWAWGVSRIIDVIEKSGGNILKPDAVGVAGCSRFGKGAFSAGVFDQRVALTMPIESGSAGVPIWRGIPGEGAQTLSSAFGEQPWLGDAFGAFTSRPTNLPLDTHELVAMVAPRGLFIMENPFIANLGPKSGHVAALAGAEVYKALGAGSNITYYSDVQSGTHCSMRPEWSAPLRSNIRKFLTRTGNDPGVIRASASATGRLADWSDWTTPTLK